MRLVIITTQAFSLANFRGSLIASLVARGVEVYAVAPDYSADSRGAVEALGAHAVDCSFSRTGINPVLDFIDTLRLSFLLKRLRPDVTLGYFIKPVIFGTLAAWLARVPLRVAMIEGLGYVFTDSGTPASIGRRLLRSLVCGLYRVALARAHKVIFLNEDDLNEFLEARLVGPSKAIKLGGIGVDLQAMPLTASVTHPVTFLLAARLLREKGILEYAAAARKVKLIHPETRFVLLGGVDPNPGGLEAQEVRSWVDAGLLEWPGHVPVKPWLAMTSVYVLPSYYREGVPRSSQEAMAMGRPVITTHSPGCRETVVDGLNGFLVPVRDSEALAAAMLRFVDAPELIATMGIESRRLAEQRFDVRVVDSRLIDILELSRS
jgi:glycosyltransferase involved in cell wall biosynthesis